jgi:hypothetical protein
VGAEVRTGEVFGESAELARRESAVQFRLGPGQLEQTAGTRLLRITVVVIGADLGDEWCCVAADRRLPDGAALEGRVSMICPTDRRAVVGLFSSFG